LPEKLIKDMIAFRKKECEEKKQEVRSRK
jgi:hypothetical protein